jgi:hypothetical protein
MVWVWFLEGTFHNAPLYLTKYLIGKAEPVLYDKSPLVTDWLAGLLTRDQGKLGVDGLHTYFETEVKTYLDLEAIFAKVCCCSLLGRT